MKDRSLPLLCSVLFLGALSLIAQVLIIREFLVIFYGNELCLGLVFGGWFIGIALGAALGGARLQESGRTPQPRISDRARSQYVSLLFAAPLVFVIQIIAIRAVRGFLGVPPGESIALAPMAVASVVLVAPFSALVGALFPAACVQGGGGARQIGRVYVWEAAGSMLGGVILTFFLIPKVPPLLLAGVLACGAAAWVLVLQRWKPLSWHMPAAIVLMAASLLMAAGGGWSRIEHASAAKRWNDLSPGVRLVESADSVYQHIDAGSFDHQMSLYGNGQLISTFPDPHRSAPMAHLSLSLHPAPGSVLIMGAAMGDFLSEMLRHPVQKLHVVELDDRLLAMTLKYEDERYKETWADVRVRVIHDDGRRFIRQRGESYDVIIVNAPEPSTALLNRFYTLEFYQEAHRRLNQGGIFITGVTSAVNYIGGDVGLYTASIFRTLQAVFPHVAAVPGERTLFAASTHAGALTLDPRELARRYRERAVASEYFSPLHFESLLPAEHVQFMRRALEGVTAYRINTDAHPVAYFYHMVLWELFSAWHSKDTSSILRGLSWVDARLILLVLAFLTGLRLLRVAPWKRPARSHAPFNAMLAIAATGFAAMAIEMVMLFEYQTQYGYLYHRVGLVVASFMLGLAVGGWGMSRALPALKDARLWLITMQLLVVGYVLSLPSLMALFRGDFSLSGWSEGLFMVWVSVAGILTGGVFPLSGALYLSRRPQTGEAAGWINAMDHAGAFMGAVLTGTLFLPLVGLAQTCVIVAAVNAVSAFLMVLDRITAREHA